MCIIHRDPHIPAPRQMLQWRGGGWVVWNVGVWEDECTVLITTCGRVKPVGRSVDSHRWRTYIDRLDR